MVEQKYLFGYASTVRDEVNELIKAGWIVEPLSMNLAANATNVFSSVLLYREKKD